MLLVGACGRVAATPVATSTAPSSSGVSSTSGTTTSTTSSTTTTTVPVPGPGGYDVGWTFANWVEPGGTTYDYFTGTTTPGRALQVDIYYPTFGGSRASDTLYAPPAAIAGGFPLVVFAHGYDVDPTVYLPLLDSWVRAGFVVAAPVFPDTSESAVVAQHGVNTEGDQFNQPQDVAFVVNELVDAARGGAVAGATFLDGRIDTAAVALAGQSDGADTVGALLFDSAYAPVNRGLVVQPGAVLLLSGAEWTRAEDSYSPPPAAQPAVLVVQSATDACNVPQDSVQLYNMVGQPKWYLGLDDASHLGPYTGDQPAAGVVEAVTTRFLEVALRPGTVSTTTLQRAGEVPGVSSITEAPSVPAIAPPPVKPGVDPCAATP